MRAIATSTLADAWPLDDNDPRRYARARPPMYTTAAEAALSSPAVVNDVVFCSTSRIAVYAFSAADGTCLWQNVLGEPTGGLQGGYGYCMGPAVAGDYVVAGALVFGRQGGLLRIYRLPQTQGADAAASTDGSGSDVGEAAAAAGGTTAEAGKAAAGDKAAAKNRPIAQWPRGTEDDAPGRGGGGVEGGGKDGG